MTGSDASLIMYTTPTTVSVSPKTVKRAIVRRLCRDKRAEIKAANPANTQRKIDVTNNGPDFTRVAATNMNPPMNSRTSSGTGCR